MEDLHNALISNATPVHASVNYINADEDLQNQFDQALQQAKIHCLKLQVNLLQLKKFKA